jgi:signal transduction histidine kinase
MMVRRVWGSLRTRYRRLLILIAVAAVLPMATYGSMQTWLRASAERRAIEANNLEEAERLALRVDNELMAETNALRMLSLSHDLDIDDLKDFYDLARRAHFENKLWHSVIIVDPRTDLILLNTLFPMEKSPYPTQDHKTVREVVETHAVVIGAPTPAGPIAGTDRMHPAFVPLRVPVMRRDEVHYILSASMAPDQMRALLWNATPPGLGGDSYLVDPTGLIVARNRSPANFAALAPEVVRASLAHHKGIYRGVTADGREEVFAFATAPFSHWSVHLGMPIGQYNAPLQRSFYITTAGMVLSAVLALGLIVMIWREIVRQRREENALQSARRMEAIGQLTAGVAHDFNNLLTTVIGNLEIIEARVTGKSLCISRNIRDALKAAEHGAKMTQQLLSFAGKQVLLPEPLDLNVVVREIDGLINQTVVGCGIRVHFDLCRDRCLIVVDPRELSLSILNLVMNARDAMPEGGSLTIKTERVDLPIGKQFDDLQPGRYAVFNVIDTGTGMTEEVMARAFEPFFTTKEIGKGTGLGLSQVYGIVKQSGGTVRLKSEVGRGSEVEIWLPEYGKPIQPAEIAV